MAMVTFNYADVMLDADYKSAESVISDILMCYVTSHNM